MNLPNKLTMFRILLVPVFVFLMISDAPDSGIWAAVVFVAASLTDTADGYIARKYHLVTNFGKFMDPLADKLLVTAALICFVDQGITPAWIVIAILAREFFVTGRRTGAGEKGVVIAASPLGKLKTISQMAGIIILLLGFGSLEIGVFSVAGIVNAVMLVTTLWSGIDYVVKSRQVLQK
jgi:CDP-diacylglycerol--glycerol-3-phosphate 3-phosphatidyltransferase